MRRRDGRRPTVAPAASRRTARATARSAAALLVAVLLVLLVAGGCGATSDTQRSAQATETRTYSDADHGFSFAYDPARMGDPAPSAGGPGEMVTSVQLKDVTKAAAGGESLAWLVVSVFPSPKGEEYDAAGVDRLAASLREDPLRPSGDLKVVDAQAGDLGGHPCVVVDLSGAAAGTAMMQRHWFTVANGLKYVVTIQTPETDWQSESEYLARIVDSFTLTEPSAK
jgi:hypothetical protein